jgi:hypothetical protein
VSEHIEPKPLPVPTWREMLDRAMRQTDEACKLAADWKAMYYAAIAERDAACAELKKKEEGK